MTTHPGPETVGSSGAVDIWDLLERSVAANPPAKPSTPAATTTEKPKRSNWKTRFLFWLLDFLGLAFWGYVLLKLFVVDIDRVVVDAIWPSAGWLLGYRALVILFVVFLVAAFFWRWPALLGALYVAFYPLVVLCWKLPNLVVRLRLYRSWAFWMLLLNGLTVFFRNLRYHLVSKSLWIIAASAILLTSSRLIVVPAAAIVAVLLLAAAVRVVAETFQPSWFLKSQKNVLELVTEHVIAPSVRWQEDISVGGETGVLGKSDVQALSGKIQMGIAATYGLYLWAYKLQQYRERRLALLFSWSAYAWLFLGSLASFTLLNTAVLKMDSGQYSFESYPSLLQTTAYTLSTLVLNDGGGVSPDGDVAYVLRIAAGLFGLLFLGAFVLNVAFALFSTRHDEELGKTVADLRMRARANESDIRNAIKVSLNEACGRFVQLGLGGMQFVVRYVQEAVPPDFFDVDGNGDLKPS